MALDRNHWRTASLYVGSVVLVNVGFSLSPQLDWLWSLVVGGVLVLRDLAQRSWGHRTLALMLDPVEQQLCPASVKHFQRRNDETN